VLTFRYFDKDFDIQIQYFDDAEEHIQEMFMLGCYRYCRAKKMQRSR
jgi:hypothetical protein